MLELMEEFHRYSKFTHGFKSSFIALIPKKNNPVGVQDYRPISLINSIYKVVAKV